MNIVLIIPTGIGAEIGGHAGDANPVAKLMASCCDKLITHPNVVNASDINEMTENTLYVEGSILDRFLWGDIGLLPVTKNKVLVAVNAPADEHTINAVSAGRVTIGLDAKIIELNTPLEMIATMENGIATGIVNGWEELCEQVQTEDFDALAIISQITVNKECALHYLNNGGVNPWGGVEAKLSKLVATKLNKPVAHAPQESGIFKEFKQVVDPRLSAECISVCYMHCVLKGLNRAPKIVKTDYWHNTLTNKNVDVLVSPYGCWGEPHNACIVNDIPIIVVKENKTVEDKVIYGKEIIVVENYWEAIGVIQCMKAGIYEYSVRRPINKTDIIKKD